MKKTVLVVGVALFAMLGEAQVANVNNKDLLGHHIERLVHKAESEKIRAKAALKENTSQEVDAVSLSKSTSFPKASGFTEKLDSIVLEKEKKYIYQYDENGYLISQSEYSWVDSAWNILSVKNNAVDVNGFVLSHSEYNYSDGEVSDAFGMEYTRDEEGRALQTISYSWTGDELVPSTKTIKAFDVYGNQILDERYKYADGSWIGWLIKKERAYDENGNETMYAAYRWKNDTWEGYGLKKEQAYDSKNRLQKEAKYQWKDGAWVGYSCEDLEYDEYGNTAVEIVYGWSDSGWKISYYALHDNNLNEKGQIQDAMVYLSKDGKVKLVAASKEYYEYDSNGFLIMEVDTVNNGRQWLPTYKWEYVNNEDGQMVSTAYYIGNGSGWEGISKTEKAYDSKGNVVLNASYEWEDDTWVGDGDKEEYAYDESGNEIMYAVYEWEDDDWMPNAKDVNQYDENGNRLLYEYYDGDDGEWQLSVRDVRNFNERNQCVLYVRYVDVDGVITEKTKYEHEYDKNGNETVSSSYSWQDGAWKEVERIVYTYDLAVLSENIMGGAQYNKQISGEYKDESGVRKISYYYSKINAGIIGDVDGDGIVNTADVVAIYNHIIYGDESGISVEDADVDGDGEVNSSDVVAVYNVIIGVENGVDTVPRASSEI